MAPEATYVLESLATVVVFGAALWGVTYGLRRIGYGASRNGPMQVLARQPLDGRRAIYLVRVGKRVLVVGATDASLTRLGSTTVEALGLDAPTAREAAPRTSFRDVIGRDKKT